MGELIGQGANFIARQTVLQRAQPCLGDQRLGQMFIHLAVPIGQQLQRLLAHPLGRAVRGCVAGKPQIGTDKRQQAARGGGNRIQLRLDKAVAGMHGAGLHQRKPALNTLRVAPIKADMKGKGPVDDFVVGIAQKPRGWVHKARIIGIGQDSRPTVCAFPTGGGHPALAAMTGIARRHRADQLHGHAIGIGKCQVLRRRDIKCAGLDRLGHGSRYHQLHRRCHRSIGPRQRRPLQRRHIALRCDGRQIVMRARQDRPGFRPTQRDRHRISIFDGNDGLAGKERLWAIGRQIFLWVIRVDPFNHHILIVQIG